ncbi:hypothetical protein LguiB_000889 [Lonicera macranthoides]
MDFKCVFSFLMSIVSIFSVVCLSSAFDPPDNYLIDCGSPTNTTVSGDRVFIADSLASKYLSTQANILANSSREWGFDFLPYRTARIFLGNSSSTYTFPISQPGRHWIRFYFGPFAHTTYNMSIAKFSVSTQNHALLANFTPKVTVMKEYSINISSSSLIITFTPSENSLAFINALELVSMPDNLITNNAATTKGGKFQGLFSQALETTARLNMGGPRIRFYDDNQWRDWVPDTTFLTDPNLAFFTSNMKAVKHRDGAARDTAPDLVYSTATIMSNPHANYNLTWEFTVDPGFKYLIRFHFCDIVSIKSQLHFYVYVNSTDAFPGFNLSAKNSLVLGVPYYMDFVTALAIGRTLLISIGPSTTSEDHNAFLNGLEIMKMNNSVGSLSGVADVGPSLNTKSKTNVGLIVGVSVGVPVALAAVVGFFVIITKLCKKFLKTLIMRRISQMILERGYRIGFRGL